MLYIMKNKSQDSSDEFKKSATYFHCPSARHLEATGEGQAVFHNVHFLYRAFCTKNPNSFILMQYFNQIPSHLHRPSYFTKDKQTVKKMTCQKQPDIVLSFVCLFICLLLVYIYMQ